MQVDPQRQSRLDLFPRELVHNLARFVPHAVVFLVRANRALWTRFSNDLLAWSELVKLLWRRHMGFNILENQAPTMLKLCPALNRMVPLQIISQACDFHWLPDGRVVCFSKVEQKTSRKDDMVRVMCYETREVLQSHVIQAQIESIAISPSAIAVAFVSNAQYVSRQYFGAFAH